MGRPVIKISQADRKVMIIVGMIRFPVEIGRMNSVHKLYVILNLCGEMILGED